MKERLGEFDARSSRNNILTVEANYQTKGVKCYNPDLTSTESPCYYESNQLLYELQQPNKNKTFLLKIFNIDS